MVARPVRGLQIITTLNRTLYDYVMARYSPWEPSSKPSTKNSIGMLSAARQIAVKITLWQSYDDAYLVLEVSPP